MQGTECWGWGRGSFLPTPTGQRTVPFLILERLKCNDDPFPSFAEGSLPCHSQAGTRRQGLGASRKGQQWLLPTLLGTKYI